LNFQIEKLPLFTLALIHLALIVPVSALAGLELTLKTDSSTHIYANSFAPEIIVECPDAAAAQISYHWEDYSGASLSEAKSLDDDGSTVIVLPESLPYFIALVFESKIASVALAGRQPGEAKSYGFVVFSDAPPAAEKTAADSWMGVVHANIDDPWMSGWLKSMTWKTTSAKWWQHEMDKRKSAGFIELPIITGSEWKSADDSLVDAAQLQRLRQRTEAYMGADPSMLYWETGIEENLGGRFAKPYYFDNLDLKSDVVRSVADTVNPQIKLLFQIANMRSQDVRVFLDSEASKNYDIIALHPYKWPDFPAPELWLEGFLDGVQQQIVEHDRDMPIWVTEVGAPHQGNSPGEFFGYPKKQKPVRGLSPQEMVAYLIKFHVMSHYQGVERVFWYNYKDRGPNRDYAEDHFGLIDYWGHPKPAYPAYVTMLNNLADKSAGKRVRFDDVWAYEFASDDDAVVVAWSYPAKEIMVKISDLGVGYSASEVSVSNALGEAVSFSGSEIRLSTEPVYIRVGRN
jgi:hypothetical protein